ncbi:MAG: esterase family protein [Muribaculaceae bacterium]|nr:esterase family protein [Muribaculaceae bacterium]
MKPITLAFFLLMGLASEGVSAAIPEYEIVTDPCPESAYGTITRYAVRSENLQANITVDVWTPQEYDSTEARRYPVVYAHDGQNLFDGSFSFAGVAWAVDKACAKLAADSNFDMPIVVGINNRGAEGLRPNDYFPENALDYIAPDLQDYTYIYQTCNDIFYGNEQAAFVAEELKPLIDSLYMTAPGMESTFAMGSSMGGLASMYLLCEYPEIFGGAACLSTHWIGSLNLNPDYSMNDDEICAQAILDYLSDHIPTDGLHRLYMDQGTKDWDAGYLKYEVKAREIVAEKGYTQENGLLYVYDAKGAGHNEWYWQQRVRIPLKFLLSKSVIEGVGVSTVKTDEEIAFMKHSVFDLLGREFSVSDVQRLPHGIYVYKGRKVMK